MLGRHVRCPSLLQYIVSLRESPLDLYANTVLTFQTRILCARGLRITTTPMVASTSQKLARRYLLVLLRSRHTGGNTSHSMPTRQSLCIFRYDISFLFL